MQMQVGAASRSAIFGLADHGKQIDVRAVARVERLVHAHAAHGLTEGAHLTIVARFRQADLCAASAMFGEAETGETCAASLAEPNGALAARIGGLRWRSDDDWHQGSSAELDRSDPRYPLIVFEGDRLAGFELFLHNPAGAVLAIRPCIGGWGGSRAVFQIGTIDESGRLMIGATGRLDADVTVRDGANHALPNGFGTSGPRNRLATLPRTRRKTFEHWIDY